MMFSCAELVPRKISYNQFWVRYFYALYLVKEKEQKRKALLDRFLPQPDEEGDTADGWGDDTWGDEAKSPTIPTVSARTTSPSAKITPKASAQPRSPPERNLKKLRARIKEFDDVFTTEHCRSPTAKDRRPIQDVVLLYKELKAEAAAAVEEKPTVRVDDGVTTEELESGPLCDTSNSPPCPPSDVPTAHSPMDMDPTAESEPTCQVLLPEEDLLVETVDSVVESSELADAAAPDVEEVDETAGQVPTAVAEGTPKIDVDGSETNPSAAASAEPETDVVVNQGDDSTESDGVALDGEDDGEISFKAVDTDDAPGSGPTPDALTNPSPNLGDEEGDPTDSPHGSDDSNMGVNSIPSSSGTEPGSSSSSFEVLEPMTEPDSDTLGVGANGAEGDEWGDW
jgi:hypothetical protein